MLFNKDSSDHPMEIKLGPHTKSLVFHGVLDVFFPIFVIAVKGGALLLESSQRTEHLPTALGID